MRLLADKNGEQFLSILEQSDDQVLVQFISNQGELEGKPFNDSLKGLLMVGWSHRATSTAIGLSRFKQGYLEDFHVSFALHQLYPLGRKVKLPSGQIATIASYANTHADGYYMYVRKQGDEKLTRLKMTPAWELLPSEKLLALPYLRPPRSEAEWKKIEAFDSWAGGF